MKKGIVGKKIGMTQIFDDNGKVIPVTVVEAGPCVVVQKKTAENDGYSAVQLGFGEISVKNVNKPQMCIRDRHIRNCDVNELTNVHMHIIIKGNQNGWRSSERKCIRCQEAQNAGASAPSQAAAAFLRSTGKGRPSL